ncbi:DNA repair protein RecN [Clostridium oryzae]|uniref:DNA repair protein RecN n=1 Tax=Clostridium oryzae TaxID=1450648 RepID=A0A1V4ITH6_9CLOT|nr:DNA repair protein RecN [Clostridium oryzae]OPJ63193.1 DNA repair protein RecN [Clostridium oryzae]
MLLQINIKNFALIEELSLNFEKGFNVLTGETGAGKSILIDSINYVLGSKFSTDFIRSGEKSTYVEAVFTVDNDNTRKVLHKQDIESDDIIIISREGFSSGRSISKINGKSVILSSLRAVTSTLLDIHGQHENVHLLDSSTHIDYLDAYCGEEFENSLVKYKNLYGELNEIIDRIKKLEGTDTDNEKLINYLSFQISEIENAKLHLNEDTELEQQYEILNSSEKINNMLNSSYEILYNGTDSCPSISESLDTVIRNLRTIDSKLNVAKDIADSLEESYYNIEDNISKIRDIKDKYYYDQNEMEAINARIYEIARLKKKYGSTIDEIFTYLEKLNNDYNEIKNRNEILEKLYSERNSAEQKCYVQAKFLHELREQSAKKLEENIKKELAYIGMQRCNFKVEFQKLDELNARGFDKVQFMLAANAGDTLKPLDRIASGGELSRIMLSMKNVFIDKDQIPTVIFDEIDTGISGAIAQRVAEKMYLISCSHQVFCVTHLPQIASMSDMHYNVYKEVIGERTYTRIKKLNKNEKIFEISKMIGGIEVTKITQDNAKQIITMAEKTKKSIKI